MFSAAAGSAAGLRRSGRAVLIYRWLAGLLIDRRGRDAAPLAPRVSVDPRGAAPRWKAPRTAAAVSSSSRRCGEPMDVAPREFGSRSKPPLGDGWPATARRGRERSPLTVERNGAVGGLVSAPPPARASRRVPRTVEKTRRSEGFRISGGRSPGKPTGRESWSRGLQQRFWQRSKFLLIFKCVLLPFFFFFPVSRFRLYEKGRGERNIHSNNIPEAFFFLG